VAFFDSDQHFTFGSKACLKSPLVVVFQGFGGKVLSAHMHEKR
jgi:hypothetical protein